MRAILLTALAVVLAPACSKQERTERVEGPPFLIAPPEASARAAPAAGGAPQDGAPAAPGSAN